MDNFNGLGIGETLINTLELLDIKKPTEVQERAIPLILEGKNVIAQSETGTGKTLAYLLPIIENLEIGKKETQVIIVAPTHELVVQINDVIAKLKEKSNLQITSTSLIGTGNLNRQIEKLKKKPNIIVGSAGRILEIIGKKKLSAHTVNTIVLDEGDKLFDKKNLEVVKGIMKSAKRDVQKLIVSATLTEKTLEIAKEIINHYEIIKTKEKNRVNENVEHGFFLVNDRDKLDLLRKIIHAEKHSKIMVFIEDSYNASRIVSKLQFHKIKVNELHGEVSKEDRQKALQEFRRGKVNVLLATDVASRGLDIEGITHVINLTVPRSHKDYIHRAGRVGRAGNTGISFSMLSPKEIIRMQEISNKLQIEVEEYDIYKGEIFKCD